MKRALWFLVAIGFVAAVGFALFRRNDQPSYQGRSLASWLSDYGTRPIGGGLIHDKFTVDRRQPAKSSPGHAVRAMGTNVIKPLLAEMKCPDGPPWLNRASEFFNSFRWLRLEWRDPQARREQAALAFFDLGTAGVAAIPELAQLLTNYSTAVFAAHALAGMGTNAIPAFTAALESPNTWIMDCGAWGLAQIGAESRDTVPRILLQLPKGSTADQMLLVWALSEIREPSEIIVNELRMRLKHLDPRIRRSAAHALKKFGQNATPASAEVKAALDNESDPDTRTALEELTKEINRQTYQPGAGATSVPSHGP